MNLINISSHNNVISLQGSVASNLIIFHLVFLIVFGDAFVIYRFNLFRPALYKSKGFNKVSTAEPQCVAAGRFLHEGPT